MLSLKPSRLFLSPASKKSTGVKARRQMRVFSAKDSLVKFPFNYYQVTSQSQDAVRKALADGHKLLEVEFPSLGLDTVPGSPA
eukprot:1184578-Prorocentrum_minimum.AAC.3